MNNEHELKEDDSPATNESHKTRNTKHATRNTQHVARNIFGWFLAFGGLFLLVWSTWPTTEPTSPTPNASSFEPPTSVSDEVSEQSVSEAEKIEWDDKLGFFKEIKTAVIIDQLSHHYPNPAFVQTATLLLEAAGYTVNYIPADEVTVNFYRDLPMRGDDFLLLRVHGTAVTVDKKGELIEENFVSLATGEPESTTAHPQELRQKWLGRFRSDDPTEPIRLIAMEGFFKNAMRGQFDDSIIVLMGCDGLRVPGTADFFIERGAQAVVGWSDNVGADHMDKAIAYLLEQHLVENQPIEVAVNSTHAEIGADPYFKAELQATVR
ncbi:hypothetical protein QUF63_17660 [Anaerolineales bacterium HSG25]|nr:hypothetical protein [Anaerolineales bacterium HSG25]